MFLLLKSSKLEHTLEKGKSYIMYGPRPEKPRLRGAANNKGADQPAHPRSLISTFVIRLLKNIISRFATSVIFNFLGSLCS